MKITPDQKNELLKGLTLTSANEQVATAVENPQLIEDLPYFQELAIGREKVILDLAERYHLGAVMMPAGIKLRREQMVALNIDPDTLTIKE